MVSAVILTHNDEDLISNVLETLKWCDERIIVDDNSTDRTLEVVKPYNVTIIQHALNDNFSAQRNFGLAKAKGEWVLFVDSDELVSSKLREEILKCIQDDTYVGYYIKRKDVLFGRELRYGEIANVKLSK